MPREFSGLKDIVTIGDGIPELFPHSHEPDQAIFIIQYPDPSGLMMKRVAWRPCKTCGLVYQEALPDAAPSIGKVNGG